MSEVPVMDYRALLKRYIRHLWDVEGADFIDNMTYYHPEPLSEEDKQELRRLVAEMEAERNAGE